MQVECKRFLGVGQGAEGVEKVLGEVLGAGQGAVVVVDAGVGAGCAWGRTRLWGELNKCLGSGEGAGGLEEGFGVGQGAWGLDEVLGELRSCRGSGGGDWGRGRVQED